MVVPREHTRLRRALFGWVLIAAALSPGRSSYAGQDDAAGKRVAPVDSPRFEVPEDQSLTDIACSADGKKLVAVTMSGATWLWDAEAGGKPRGLSEGRPQGNPIKSAILRVAFSPDGKNILLACGDSTVKVWDVDGGKESLVFKGHRGPIWSVAVSKDGKRAFSGSTSDYTIKVWELNGGKELENFQSREQVSCIALSSDERTFAVPVFKTVELWDRDTRRVIRSFHGHGSRVRGVMFLAGDQRIISASLGEVREWDVQSGETIRKYGDGDILVEKATLSADGRILLLAAAGSCQVWETGTGTLLKKIDGLKGSASVAFVPGGRRFIVADAWGGPRQWEILPTAEDNKKR